MINDMSLSATARFWSKVTPTEDGCWSWDAGRTPDGYGLFKDKGAQFLTHRLAYQIEVGPIPVGLELDHLCRVRHCCNPAHLEPVTPRVNTHRSHSPSGVNSRKKFCWRGHELVPEIRRGEPTGRRTCKACKRITYVARRDALAALREPSEPRPNWQARRTTCRRGHPYDEANTFINARGHRCCRVCTRAADKARKAAA